MAIRPILAAAACAVAALACPATATPATRCTPPAPIVICETDYSSQNSLQICIVETSDPLSGFHCGGATVGGPNGTEGGLCGFSQAEPGSTLLCGGLATDGATRVAAAVSATVQAGETACAGGYMRAGVPGGATYGVPLC